MTKVYGYQIFDEKPEIFRTKEGRDNALLFYVEQNWENLNFDTTFDDFRTAEEDNDPVGLYFEIMQIKTGKQPLRLFESEINDFEAEYPVERVLTMSSRHMPSREPELGCPYFAIGHGGEVHIVLVDTEEKISEVPEWMRPAAKYAYDRQCQFIIFDDMAAEIKGIPVYDWGKEDAN